jgi:hypothetical protein
MLQPKLTKRQMSAVNTLCKQLQWSDQARTYLLAYMQLLSGFDPNKTAGKYDKAVGYILLSLHRLHTKKITKFEFFRMKPEEQILWLINMLDKNCDTLLDVSRTVLGVPKNAMEDYNVFNTIIQYLPEYKHSFNITMGDIMNEIRNIVNGEMA